MTFYRKSFVLALFLSLLIMLTSCSNSFYELSDDSPSDVFCRDLIDHVIAEEKEAAYAMLNSIVGAEDFEDLWSTFRTSADGAADADIHQTYFWLFTEDGIDYFKGQYLVEFDNGKYINLALLFEDGNIIRTITYLDITDFYPDAIKTSEILNIILTVYSLLALGFCIWMIVDCARRPMRKKALWIIIILVGFSLTLTIGRYGNNANFMVGFLFELSNASVDLGSLAIAAKAIIPLGAIIYFCMRKRLTIVPPTEDPTDDLSNPDIQIPTE